ncbi:MAG: Fur family transcriptional regulator [Planctomycetota bacterium]|jgi:Fur family ferric uptake transcriptional regulator|nr:Fur family transcriptional regulator [Planctomycetota bacterium]MDP6938189.1 Fur family transcriptional regulator [Planctomycetota bacterium]
MQPTSARRRFERHLQDEGLRLTAQRLRVLERVFGTHEHFSAETLFGWLRADDGPSVSRATVYRTLELLASGGFVTVLDTGRGEMLYEHSLGHTHHDHLVCTRCGRIEEFREAQIEKLQKDVARKHRFELTGHVLRLTGICRSCQKV